MNDIGVIGGADGETVIMVSGIHLRTTLTIS